MAKILFFKTGSFSGINANLLDALRAQFPRDEVTVVDTFADWVRPSRSLRLAAGAWALSEFLPLILRRRRNLPEVYLRSGRLERHFQKRAASTANSAGPLAFSFATQSLFDLSVPGLPHFIFTDHTHLANLYYPAFDRRTKLPEAAIDRERKAYERAERLFVMGSHVKRSLGEHYGIAADKIMVCGGGPNTAGSVPLDNRKFSNGRIAFLGIDWERKGGPLLLDAFRIVKRRVPGAVLEIIGCRPRDLPDGAVAHGRVPNTEAMALLARASVFAFPTLIEPFGIAPIEAATLGLPVVASNLGAMPEIVRDGHSGILVPPGDANALASALLQLLTDSASARAMGANGRAHALANFNWGRVGELVGAGIRDGLTMSSATGS